MSEVLPRNVLLRIGGRTWQRYGAFAVAGAARGLTPIAYTFARADATSCARFFGRDGLSYIAAANVLRIEWLDLDGDGVRETPGILIEGSRTNVVLHNRDLANAAWTKTNVSAVKDQTGIDGVPNSASRITASAGNGTCLQSITLASSERFQSCYIKRLVGSGTINMTTDNGSTWTAVTVTNNWTRVTIPKQTLANPIVGFRIVTNTDSVAVDFVQNENGPIQSSPIAVTTTAVTRAADSLSLSVNFGNDPNLTILERWARPVHADAPGTLGITPHTWSLGTAVPLVRVRWESASRAVGSVIDTATTDSSVTGVSIPAGAEQVYLTQIKNLRTGGQVAFDVGTGLSGFASAATAFSAFGNQTLQLGFCPVTGEHAYAVLLDLIIARGLFTRSEMMALA